MKRVLGLDLGTASIGWAIVNQAENENENSSIVKIGVRVNPLTVDEKSNFESGKSITTNADRTLKRGMRRNLQRYKLRRSALLQALIENHIISNDTILSEDGNNSTFETYRLRSKAASEEISLEQFARVLFMINKKRGYKSSRKAKNEEEGQLIDGMSIAKALYDEHLTPGQFTLRNLENDKRYIPAFYRSDLANELDQIWSFQKQYYPEILTDEFRLAISGKSKLATNKHFYGAYKIFSEQEKDKNLKIITPYRWRVKALSEQLPIEQLAAVICDINGAISNASGYLGSISDRSKELFFNHQTIGQYLMNGIESNSHYRIKNQVFYRQDYLDEFETIWETQAKFHPELTPELKETIRDIVIFYQRKLKSQKDLISLCEFEQHTITVKIGDSEKQKTIGPRVCPKSSPLFQEFRIWQAINNLVISSDSDNRPLTQQEKETIHDELTLKEKLSATQILSIIGLNKIKGETYKLNFKELKGNTTIAKLFDCFMSIYDMSGHDAVSLSKMSAHDKVKTMSSVFAGLGYKTDFLVFQTGGNADNMQQNVLFRLWHILYSYVEDKSKTGNEKLIKKISNITGFEKEYASLIANITFEPDYGSLSSKAMLKILPFLQQGQIYSDACISAGYRHSKSSLTKDEIQSRELKGKIDILPKNSLRNPVVEKILNQMINVVNELTAQYGKSDAETGINYFDEVHIELARELKKSADERKSAYDAINTATREYENLRKEISEITNSPQVSRNDLIRYRLYLELKDNGFHTLYSNTYIPKEKVFSGDFDIEHIIPQSKLFDDSFSNKTLETRDVNLRKGNMTAYDYVAQYGNLDEYLSRIKYLDKDGTKSKYKKLLMKEDEIPSDFINRDLRDSQYIARKAKELLYDITRVVVSTTGSITDRLREDWQLVDTMKELNWDKYDKLGLTTEYKNRDGQTIRKITDWTKRNDHRHHAMDALTIAFTKPSHIQYLNNLNARSNKAGAIYAIEQKELKRDEKDNHLRFISPIQPVSEFRREALKQLSNILVSIKAKNKVTTNNINKTKKKGGFNKTTQLTPRGQLHNETVYGQHKKEVVKLEKVGSTFDESKISTVCNPTFREALLGRLYQYNGNPKKAFSGANSLTKKPIYLNPEKTACVPEQVKTKTYETIFTIRKEITPDLKLDKVVDEGIKRILQARLNEFGGDAKKAFANLDENPIWLNKEQGICIKSVAIKGVNVATPLHEKRDKDGNYILDKDGNRIPTDYVSTSNNHHVEFFVDQNGDIHDVMVSYFEAVERRRQGFPIIDKQYNYNLGWRFMFSMKQNEYFVFPQFVLDENGKETSEMIFNPKDIDLFDSTNNEAISRNLFRVQKMSCLKYGNGYIRDYVFRHHLETIVSDNKVLLNVTYKQFKNNLFVKNIVKVRVNSIGQIVSIGEY